MKSNPKCSIIIRTHNHKELLEKLLAKIKEQKNVSKPEIVIVDSSSDDGTLEVAKKEKCKVVVINPKDFGHSITLNIGAKNSKNEILVYVSVDIIPTDELWLFNLIKHFDDKKVAGVFGKQIPIPNFNPIEEYKVKRMFPEKKKSVALFSCASGAIRKSVWKRVNFDEGTPYRLMGGQDQTWVVDVKKLGYKTLYEPKSVVFHSHRYPLKSRRKIAYLDGYYEREAEEFNRDIKMLNYSKIDLIKFLLVNLKFRDLFFDLLFGGLLVRISHARGRKDRAKGVILN